MKKIHINFLPIIALFAFSAIGCGGSGNSPANPFAGGKALSYFDADQSNSTESGYLEFIVQSNGQLSPNGAAYVYEASTGSSLEGTILVGSIQPDGTSHLKVRIDMSGWPPQAITPYYMTVDGTMIRRGAHYEGALEIKYFDDEACAPGTEEKDIPYDGSMSTILTQVRAAYSEPPKKL